jgi:hypothetical protein
MIGGEEEVIEGEEQDGLGGEYRADLDTETATRS